MRFVQILIIYRDFRQNAREIIPSSPFDYTYLFRHLADQIRLKLLRFPLHKTFAMQTRRHVLQLDRETSAMQTCRHGVCINGSSYRSRYHLI